MPVMALGEPMGHFPSCDAAILCLPDPHLHEPGCPPLRPGLGMGNQAARLGARPPSSPVPRATRCLTLAQSLPLRRTRFLPAARAGANE